MSKASTLLDLVCAQRQRIRVALGLVIAMGVLLVISVLYVDPGDRSYPILIVDIVLVVTTIVLFSLTHWYCTRRAMDE